MSESKLDARKENEPAEEKPGFDFSVRDGFLSVRKGEIPEAELVADLKKVITDERVQTLVEQNQAFVKDIMADLCQRFGGDEGKLRQFLDNTDLAEWWNEEPIRQRRRGVYDFVRDLGVHLIYSLQVNQIVMETLNRMQIGRDNLVFHMLFGSTPRPDSILAEYRKQYP